MQQLHVLLQQAVLDNICHQHVPFDIRSSQHVFCMNFYQSEYSTLYAQKQPQQAPSAYP